MAPRGWLAVVDLAGDTRGKLVMRFLLWLSLFACKIKAFCGGPQGSPRLVVRYANASRRVIRVKFVWAKAEWRYTLSGEQFRDFDAHEIGIMRGEFLQYQKRYEI